MSGVVRREFRSIGHDAYSCDIVDSLDNSEYHYKCDVRDVLGEGWDLMIAHPPCTDLSTAGARFLKNKVEKSLRAIEFVLELYNCNIPKICIENPVGILSTRWRKPDQIIQPWWFGGADKKRTCFWFKGLRGLEREVYNKPKLLFETVFIDETRSSRRINRSITSIDIARAMVKNWG